MTDERAKDTPEVVVPPGREASEPNDPDGVFDSQEMPTADGEMSDGGESAGQAPRRASSPASGDRDGSSVSPAS